MKECPFCHQEINDEATRCKHCKRWLNENRSSSQKKYLDTLLLSWFLGAYGIHRFYTGYIAIGVVQLLTLGGCGIWSTIDFFSIIFGAYKDSEGRELLNIDKKIGYLILGFQILVLLLVILLIISLCLAMVAAGGIK